MPVTAKLASMVLFVFQCLMIILFGVLFRLPTSSTTSVELFQVSYEGFRDSLFLVLVAFGLLTSSLKRFSWSAFGFALFAIALTFQYYILWSYFWTQVDAKSFDKTSINLSISDFLGATFASFAVLISCASIVGRVGLFEIFVIIVIHVLGYTCNSMLLTSKNYIYCQDLGGGFRVHIYGSTFAVMLIALIPKQAVSGHPKNVFGYMNGALALLGTVLMWVYWPSFNSAYAATTIIKETAVINTIFALVGSTVGAVITSLLFRDKLGFHDISKGVIVGGVMASSCSNLTQYPGALLVCGFFAGFLSASGYSSLTPYLELRHNFYDSAMGVINLFLMPAIWGAILSCVFIGSYQNNNGSAIFSLVNGRTYLQQGGYQFAGILCSVGFGIAFGGVCGLALSIIANYQKEQLFSDKSFWESIGASDTEVEQDRSSERKKKMGDSQLSHRLEDYLTRSPLKL